MCITYALLPATTSAATFTFTRNAYHAEYETVYSMSAIPGVDQSDWYIAESDRLLLQYMNGPEEVVAQTGPE